MWGGVGEEPGVAFVDGAAFEAEEDRWTSLPPLPGGVDAASASSVAGGTELRPALWAGIVLVGLCAQCWAVVMSGVVKLTTPSTVGRATGRILAGGFAGSALLPPPFGFVVDLTGRYGAAWSALALAYLLALAAVATAARPARRGARSAARDLA